MEEYFEDESVSHMPGSKSLPDAGVISIICTSPAHVAGPQVYMGKLMPHKLLQILGAEFTTLKGQTSSLNGALGPEILKA